MPRVIHQAQAPESFFLMFLSEGFTNTERNEFYSYCKDITKRLFRISPYNQGQKNIGVWAYFVSSTRSGINNTPHEETAFRFYIGGDGRLLTRQPGHIVDLLKTIQVTPHGSPIPEPCENIWLNSETYGDRAVCVVAKHSTGIKASWTQVDFDTDPLDYPVNNNDSDLNELLPYIAITAWPMIPATIRSTYTNPDDAAASLLAKELGRIFGLAYEYVRDGVNYQINQQSETEAPNIVVHGEVFPSGATFDGENLKWRDYIASHRQNAFQAFDHPTSDLVSDYIPISEAMKEKIVLLRHPDPSMLNSICYAETAGGIIYNRYDPNLIEGADFYRKQSYRSSVECLMRNEGYDVDIQGEKMWVTIPYCAICRRHITSTLTNTYNYRLGSIQIKGRKRCGRRTYSTNLGSCTDFKNTRYYGDSST